MQEQTQFLDLLNASYTWPTSYTFKFICPNSQFEELKKELSVEITRTKPSRRGNYVSVTIEASMKSAQDVLLIYEEAKRVKGVISL